MTPSRLPLLSCGGPIFTALFLGLAGVAAAAVFIGGSYRNRNLRTAVILCAGWGLLALVLLGALGVI